MLGMLWVKMESQGSSNMAAPGGGDPLNAKNGNAPFAQRIDPSREKLTPAQLQFMRQVQLAQWQKTLPQRRTWNIMTGLGIGVLVLAIYGYTFYSVAQERFLDELEDEAKAARARALERERARERERQDPNCTDHLQTAGAPVYAERCLVVSQHHWHTNFGL